MPLADKIPYVDKCCGCVTNLKTAAAIIAVLGIVTSPLVSWAIIRHSYLIRVTCVITTNTTRPDVVDITLNNALSFGFGANAGLGPSCLTKEPDKSINGPNKEDKTKSGFVRFIRYSGWIVILADAVFLLNSINFLIKMFQDKDKEASLYFMISGLISVLISFVYALLYVSACVYVGGGFPVFEFVFSIVDLILWIYYLIVVYSYRQKPS